MSHDKVKRAVGLFHGFVSGIASAPCSVLNLNNEYLIIKKKKEKKKKEKKAPYFLLFGSFTQLAHPPSIVALQDPAVYRGKLLSFN